MAEKYKLAVILLILSSVLFLAGNNILGLTNDNEVFYAQSAKEMAQHNSWMTPYIFGQPQFEKPIFIYWLTRIGFIMFGITSFGARFFPAVFGILGVAGVYLFCLIGLKDRQRAFLSGIVLMSAGMYTGMAKTLFTDMVFSTLVSLALLSFFWAYTVESRKSAGLLLFFVFSALAVLTKGPLGLILTIAVVICFLFFKKDIKFIFCRPSIWGIIVFLLIAMPWYILMVKIYGNAFIHEFIYNVNARRLVVAQHGAHNRWYYYPFYIVSAMCPWSLFVLASLAYLPVYLKKKENSFYLFLACWIGVIFFIFQMARSKVSNYILPLFPAIAVLVGVFIYDTLPQGRWLRPAFYALVGTLCVIFLMPAGIIIASIKQSAYLTDKMPVYLFAAVFFMLALIAAYFLARNKLLRCVYSFSLFVPIFLCIMPFVQNNFGAYMSSKEASEYLIDNYSVHNAILCSKVLVRGVKYYTDKDVVALDMPGSPLFSPHPIIFLNTEEQIADFLRKQGTTYCILKKAGFKAIERIAGAGFRRTVLKIMGDHYILKVEKTNEGAIYGTQ